MSFSLYIYTYDYSECQIPRKSVSALVGIEKPDMLCKYNEPSHDLYLKSTVSALAHLTLHLSRHVSRCYDP